ncbi:helix-turn-helix domain-containing protein [Flavisphingomonas formosensis]|uniref:helix-turn-helix domain-containing protein n=1 Tax=Flavisphingomonas formosensis TaxID=861534 RepID=UPI0012FB4C2E|nr:helix-turn-helix transcriptional regulator [Sphingomonas formosensis]
MALANVNGHADKIAAPPYGEVEDIIRKRNRKTTKQPVDGTRHSQSKLLKNVLKQQIRNRGLRYQDIAEHLGISVMTVKRYLNSDRVPIEALEEIGSCLGLSLIELAEIAKANDGRNKLDLEFQQESALASDHGLALLRLLLYSGMTVEEIIAEYGVDEPTLIQLLTHLDRLKLIELLPGNRVRIRGSRHIEWKAGGPMRYEIENDIRNHFVKMDFANTEEFFGYETARLSESSILQIEDQMRQLVRNVRILHQIDQTLRSDQKQWYTVLVCKRETNWCFPLRSGELKRPRSLAPDRTPYPYPYPERRQ